MPSSTSNSESAFVLGAVAVLAVVFTGVLAFGRVVGGRYRPEPLHVPAAVVEQSSVFVEAFGNSRFEAGLDVEQLAHALDRDDHPVSARAFTGGGWDGVHYLQLALLNQSALRPGRDVVLIEASPLSVDDSAPTNRLGVIRPEVAREILALPGLGTEPTLEIMLGAAAPAYRYRGQIQQQLLAPRLERLTSVLGGALVGPPRGTPSFELVTAPGRNFVVQEIRGDKAALQRVSRERNDETLARLSVGGARLEALRRAVRLLRARDVSVFLVRVPLAPRVRARLDQLPAGRLFDAELATLATADGAVVLDAWDPAYFDAAMFYDEMHLALEARHRFTSDVVRAIQATVDAR